MHIDLKRLTYRDVHTWRLHCCCAIHALADATGDRLYLSIGGESAASNCNVTITQTTPTHITLTGVALQQCYADILSQVYFLNSADEPGRTNRSIQFVITDENEFSSSATASVLIMPTNDPSVFSFLNRSLTFNETTQVPVYLFQENDTLVDSDGDSLQWVAIKIRPFADDMDVLSVDTGSSALNVSISSSGSTALNISGNASFSVYEAILQTVTFHNSYPGLSLETRGVEVVTFDGETESPPTLISISIAPFDDIPVCYFRNNMVSGVSVITSWLS